MAGDWLKMEVCLPDKPEVLVLSRALGIEPDAVIGKCFRVWRWFDQHTKDGHAPGVTTVTLLSVIGHGNGNDRFLEELQKVGWLLVDSAGITLPNFDRHNGETAKARGLAAKRKAKQRATKKSRPESDKDVTREEKRREEVIIVLSHLNAKVGRDYKPVEANTKLIGARLKEGATVADCLAVIDAKVLKWKGDAAMDQYLRPATLFNATKFAQYVGELKGAPASSDKFKGVK